MVACLKAAGTLRRMSGSRRSGEVAPAFALYAVERWTMDWAMSPQKRILRWSGARAVTMLLEKVEVDGAEAAGVDVGLGLT